MSADIPPEKSGYPPEPAPYPDQPQGQLAYPPALLAGQLPPGYAQQQMGYPTHQGFTAQQQQGYPAQQDYPMQQMPPPVAQQQQQTNVVVIGQPATPTTTVVHQPRDSSAGVGAMIFAIIVTFFGLFTGCWWIWVCSIPAIFIGLSAQNAGNRGDLQGARKNNNLSIGCSVFAIIFGVVGLGIIIGVAVGITSAAAAAAASSFGIVVG